MCYRKCNEKNGFGLSKQRNGKFLKLNNRVNREILKQVKKEYDVLGTEKLLMA
jgi:hypothetical protein